MTRIYFWIICLFSLSSLKGQIILSDIGFDKNGNRYVAGTFDKIINLGENNILSSAGESDIFLAKYNSTGTCQWATRIGGKTNDEVRSIYVEPNGNFYITGYVTGQVWFGVQKRTVGSPKLFVAKYNTSGDPVWVKVSNNKGNDNGVALQGDGKGNLYVTGSFDNTFVLDGISVISKGKNDIFVAKISTNGVTGWIKNYGTKEDDNASSLLYANGTLVIGGSSKLNASEYMGYLTAVSPESGLPKWEKNLGTKRGDITRIAADNKANYFVTGLVENTDQAENCDLLVAKLDASGNTTWLKRFHGNYPKGSDLVCDQNGGLYVCGNFSDSLKFDAVFIGGFTDDFFIAKLSPAGAVQWAKAYGTIKSDAISRMISQGNSLLLAGTFSEKLKVGNKELLGRKNSVFTSSFEPAKQVFTQANKLIEEDPNFDDNAKLSNINGKLLIGAGANKNYLSDQPLHIEDDNGNFIKGTITDEHGDFSFKNVDINSSVNLVLESSDKVKETDEIFLAEQNGVIVQKLEINKGFKFKLLPSTLHKLEPLMEEDASLLLKDFKASGQTELTFVERLYYDPNSYLIPAEAFGDLNQIAVFLRQNQKMKIEINAHTDANGDEAPNLTLSEKRANEIKNYLVKKQIQSERILVKGWGETQIINRCSNNVQCTDQEHSYNRRTEFKFTKGSGF